MSPCCDEPTDTRGCCAGCGLRTDECPTCLGEGEIEILHGSQAGREEPQTRVVACPDCADIDEPDYDRDDGWMSPIEYADEDHYGGAL